MSTYLQSRIIMLPDATVHIAFTNKTTIGCTANCLFELLSHPLGIGARNHKYIKTTERANPLNKTIEEIPGLTLMRIYSDGRTECIFPKLFQLFSEKITSTPDEIFDLKDIIDSFEYTDEKHILMKFFREFTNEFSHYITVDSVMTMDLSDKLEILKEVYNSSFLPFLTNKEKEDEDIDSDSTVKPLPPALDKLIEEEVFTVPEAAKIIGKSPSSVYRWVESKDMLLAAQSLSGKKMIPKREVERKKKEVEQKRNNKTDNSVPQPHTEDTQRKLVENSYKSLQKQLLEKSGMQSEVIEAIRIIDEYNYYLKNGYKQVYWNGRYCLIIDIQPDYVCPNTGKSNRQLIKEDKSPVVPNGSSKDTYHIHHVGQDVKSPFAIIPSADHRNYDGVFHIKRKSQKHYQPLSFGKYTICSDAELHGADFDAQKFSFWDTYIKKYDAAGSFDAIEGYDIRNDKKTRKNSQHK